MRYGLGYSDGVRYLAGESLVSTINVKAQPTSTIINGTITSQIRPALSRL